MHRESEICVLGGGPAGATAALRLARLGHDVLLVEREAFPRRHVGESLTPGILPLLDFLGLRRAVENAGFLRPRGARVRWAGVDPNATVQATAHAGPPGFQVDRGRFDQILLDAARAAGVRLLQPARALPPKRASDGGWTIALRSDDPKTDGSEIHARFLVDATGRRALLGGRRDRDAPPTLALWAYWRDAGIDDAATRVEAGDAEWFWGALLPDGTFNATVFVDPERVGTDPEKTYRELLARSDLAPCLAGRRVTEVMACDATSRHLHRPVGDDYVRVGEASFGIDPLSSQGVQTAIRSALQAAVVVHTMRRRPHDAELAQSFYRERQTESVEQHRRDAGRFYHRQAEVSPHPFWQRRAPAEDAGADAADERAASRRPPLSAAQRIRLAADAHPVDTPVLRGDFVTRARGLAHPSLERPVAFLGDLAVAPFLDALVRPGPAGELVAGLSATYPAEQAGRVLSWMWDRGLLASADRCDRDARGSAPREPRAGLDNGFAVAAFRR